MPFRLKSFLILILFTGLAVATLLLLLVAHATATPNSLPNGTPVSTGSSTPPHADQFSQDVDTTILKSSTSLSGIITTIHPAQKQLVISAPAASGSGSTINTIILSDTTLLAQRSGIANVPYTHISIDDFKPGQAISVYGKSTSSGYAAGAVMLNSIALTPTPISHSTTLPTLPPANP